MISPKSFDNPLSEEIWDSKYRYAGPDAGETSVADTWRRVAGALARAEPDAPDAWRCRFLELLDGFKFLPGGRILAGAGTRHQTTLCNCFVMGFIEDSMESIFDRLKEGALTMQWGGGIGVDFSTLRPKGTAAATRNTIASGPVSFMTVWDAMCGALLSTGARRGAMMGTLRCDHPDVRGFVDAKRDPGLLTNFNLSVQVTDEFMKAVAADADWPLCFPSSARSAGAPTRRLRWPGADGEVDCEIVSRLPARALWAGIMDAAYDTAEPGVLFVDRINRLNNLHYREQITSTNPCGEIPLPPYGACVLGSLNLTAFVDRPFSSGARLRLEEIERAGDLATRLLDDVVDCSAFPLPQQREQARGARRIGLGITGLADALLMLGLDYDSEDARTLASAAVRRLRDAAYRASVRLAEEKGAFPYFEREPYLGGEYVRALPDDIRDGIARHGIRNSHLLAIAPAGTISLLANNVSSGIEPVFAFEGRRRVLNRAGEPETRLSVDHAFAAWRSAHPGVEKPAHFVTAQEIPPEAHLMMQAVLQPLVDNSISKTINVPEDCSRADFESIYLRAYELGLKGCTVFRPNAVRGKVLSGKAEQDHPCCPLER